MQLIFSLVSCYFVNYLGAFPTAENCTEITSRPPVQNNPRMRCLSAFWASAKGRQTTSPSADISFLLVNLRKSWRQSQKYQTLIGVLRKEMWIKKMKNFGNDMGVDPFFFTRTRNCVKKWVNIYIIAHASTWKFCAKRTAFDWERATFGFSFMIFCDRSALNVRKIL